MGVPESIRRGGAELDRAAGRGPRLLAVVVLVGALASASIAALALAANALLHAGSVAPVGEIDLNPLSQRSVVLANDGSLLAVLHREENRKSVPLAEVPRAVIDTVLAVEDAAFYEHGGMDLRATARALVSNVSAGDIVQGGSTVTQQLVKNALLTPKQDLSRKVEEAVLALRLEDQMTKDQILQRYLNTVYFGNGAYGVQAAAEIYFGVDVGQLGHAEAALLAGLIRNPIGYDPFLYPELAADRRDVVLDRLVAVGQIDDRAAELIRAQPVPTERRNLDLLPKPKDYFVEEVTQRLLKDPRIGEDDAARYNALFKGGLTITTTLDPRLQTLAEEAVTSVVPDPTGPFTASVVSVDPASGAVRAMVGGRGFETDKFNIATQGAGQQPGSSFKPFVLATAVEQGISTNATIDGRGPCRVPNPGGTPDPYEVENFEGSAGGVVSLADATRNSVNCAYARLGLIVGLDKVAETTERLGITTPLPSDRPSMSLGSLEVLPIDMAGAYATFAADGVHHEPYLVEEVLDRNGERLFQTTPEGEQVISVDTARLTTEVLEGVVSGGTATRARFADRRPAAGKTGTTSDYADAWFVGYVPQLSTAVWMGSPEGNIQMRNVGGVRVTGGSYPARIWQAYMGPALAGQPVVPFPDAPPAGDGTMLRLEGEEPPSDGVQVVGEMAAPTDGSEREGDSSEDDDGSSGGQTPPLSGPELERFLERATEEDDDDDGSSSNNPSGDDATTTTTTESERRKKDDSDDSRSNSDDDDDDDDDDD
ncbi:MAG: PBP1A family penicillin-binding protein [Actinobacteria bacterium]|nr:PBP1A family penicillin-binding protein [Actinomycetota bacterium]